MDYIHLIQRNRNIKLDLNKILLSCTVSCTFISKRQFYLITINHRNVNRNVLHSCNIDMNVFTYSPKDISLVPSSDSHINYLAVNDLLLNAVSDVPTPISFISRGHGLDLD